MTNNSIKHTPMENVLRDILNEHGPMTYDELQDKIHEKEQEAIRLLTHKGEWERGQEKVHKIKYTIDIVSSDDEEMIEQ